MPVSAILPLEISYDFLHVVLIFLYRAAFVNEVYVMEAEIFDAHLLHELETCVSLLLCDCQSVSTFVPGEFL